MVVTRSRLGSLVVVCIWVFDNVIWWVKPEVGIILARSMATWRGAVNNYFVEILVILGRSVTILAVAIETP